MVGVMGIAEALEIASKTGLDLVEISPNANPPVCKIIDFGKFNYEKMKKEKEARKKQPKIHLKELKFHVQTDDHDLNFKIKHARNFLERGDRVKITIEFRGREISHIDLGRSMMDRVLDGVKDLAMIETKPKLEGNNLCTTLILDKK
jgi:translation initiation factor IF-3